MSIEGISGNEEAVRLVLAHRTALKAYVRVFIRDESFAEDTFSDVMVVILSSWDTYDRSRPFLRWAMGIARRVSLTKRREKSAEPCLLEDIGEEAVALQLESMEDEARLELRREALRGCVARLPPRHQRLIHLRYFDDRSYQEISGLAGKTVKALYVVFNRLHRSLFTCIQRELRDV